jgi:dipeptidyl aminopeptidase/acylaminoacyl peptidase
MRYLPALLFAFCLAMFAAVTPPAQARQDAPQRATPFPTNADAYEPLTIDGLRGRSYGAGKITVVRVLSRTPQFTRELFSYESDGLRITGQLTRPRGKGPFPLIILNHGYFPLSVYRTGYDTQAASDFLAARGFLCLAPDFRSHAGSDRAPNLFRAGHVIDALNLIALAQALPEAQPGKIGMWGHSNGGEITTKAMLVSDQIAAALIYAPASPNLADNYYAFHRSNTPGDPRNIADFPLTPEQAPDLYRRLSPVSFLRYAAVPVQIHYGTADASVPRRWVDMLHQGLVDAGKVSELFIYPRGTHSLTGADKQRYLQRAADFFAAHLRP